MQVTVTIESIRILDSVDDRGEIQLAAVLYDDPQDFHRSIHATNRSGRINLNDREFVPNSQLPPPLTLCVSRGSGASFALHAWDNDDPLGDRFALEFDNVGDTDDVLAGFRRDFGPQLPSGVQSASSDYLEARFRVTRSAPGQAAIICPQEAKLRTR
jgi:hypothetical protein